MTLELDSVLSCGYPSKELRLSLCDAIKYFRNTIGPLPRVVREYPIEQRQRLLWVSLNKQIAISPFDRETDVVLVDRYHERQHIINEERKAMPLSER